MSRNTPDTSPKSNIALLPTSQSILRAVEAVLESRQKAIEFDPTLNKVRIEVFLSRHTYRPVKVRCSLHSEDEISDRESIVPGKVAF